MNLRVTFFISVLFCLFSCTTPGRKTSLNEIFHACETRFVATPVNKFRIDSTLKNLVPGEEITLLIFKTPRTPHTYLMASGSWGASYVNNWSGEMTEGMEVSALAIHVPLNINPETDSICISTSVPYTDSVAIRGLYVQRDKKPQPRYPSYVFYPVLYDLLYEYASKPCYIHADSIAHYLNDTSAIIYCRLKQIDHGKLAATCKHLRGSNVNVWNELAQRSVSLRNKSQSNKYEAKEMDRRPLSAIADKYILFPDDTLRLHINNQTGKPFAIEIWEMSVNYRHKKTFRSSSLLDSVVSLPCSKLIPRGFLMVRVQNSEQNRFDIPVIINRKKNSDVVILAPSTTWLAYNAYEGKSLYRNIIDKEPVYSASYHKPITSVYFNPEYGKHDFAIVQNIYDWFDSAYGAIIVPDHYLEHHPELLSQAKTIIPAYHCEYFSVEMYQALKTLGSTRNILAIGANQVYWRINWLDKKTYECRKDGSLFSNGKMMGGYWSGLLNSEATLLGGGFCGMVEAAPYKVLNADHFLFDGCSVKNGDVFGEKGIDGLPICGDETDKLHPLSPKNAVVLAKGTNENNLGGEIIYFPRGKYGTLNTSAITSGSGLGIDPVFTAIIGNFMKTHHKPLLVYE